MLSISSYDSDRDNLQLFSASVKSNRRLSGLFKKFYGVKKAIS